MQKLLFPYLLAVNLLGVTGNAALAHHSFSAFDLGTPTEIEGTVLEFKYINPHCYIILKVKEADGRAATWTLEGMPPSFLERDGWTAKTLKPGDQIRLTVSPLRSGAAGGMWSPQGLRFRDGKSVAAGR